MSTDVTFRPRYKFHSDIEVDEIENRVKLHTISTPDEVNLSHVRGHLVLTIPEKKRHYWSPQLDISLEHESDVNKTLVRCLIGPMPTVWTMFMFFYGFFGFASFVGLTLGLSQWTLKNPMWGFWLIPVSALGMAVMWFISYEGKKLARDEMWMLKHFFDEAIGCDCFKLAKDHRDLYG